MRGLRFVVYLLLMLCPAVGTSRGQVPREERLTTGAFYFAGVVPASNTNIASEDVYVDAVVLINNGNTAVTVTVNDRSTSCASAACPLVPSGLSIAAKSVYVIPLMKVRAVGGIAWSASNGTDVVGRIVGRSF